MNKHSMIFIGLDTHKEFYEGLKQHKPDWHNLKTLSTANTF